MTTHDTRRALLEIGGEIIHRHGFNNTGINQILKSAGVPKGSFYFYFKSKEDFGLHLIEHYSHFFSEKAAHYLEDEKLPYLERLQKFFHSFKKIFIEKKYMCGCPIGNLSQELGDVNEKFRVKLDDVFNRVMVEPVRKCLEGAIAEKEIKTSMDTRKSADFIINCWQGALLRMKVAKSIEPYDLFEEMVFTELICK